VGGIRVEAVGFDHLLADDYFKADGQDGNGFPYYKSLFTSRFLYFHATDSSWYISATLGASGHGLDVKSSDGAIPIGSRSWDVASTGGKWTQRTFKATELVWQLRHIETALQWWLMLVFSHACCTAVASKRASGATCVYGEILRKRRERLRS
jgi:hypothetical protein